MNTISTQPKNVPITGTRRLIHRFYVTFGQKSPLRHGFVEILVHNGEELESVALRQAHDAAREAFGSHWSNIYKHDDFVASKHLFPAGKFGETINL